MPNRLPIVPFAALALLAACQDAQQPAAVSSPTEVNASVTAAPPPAPLVTVSAGGGSLTFWPYTGTSFSGERSDPINLIFVGEASPVSIRAALLALSGDRTALGYPASFPFDCTWRDAIGGEQTGYSHAEAWEGSVIQLECGAYETVRFHIRLFPAGEWTIANAHVDVLIPGTTDHQVLSWEVGERLVAADLLRSGLLAPGLPGQTQPIHEAPFREIPAIIYNGLPASLRQLAGGPMENVTGSVPILTDGRATILNLQRSVAPVPGVASQSLVIQFNQTIPKPFCNTGTDYIRVQGPIELSQDVRVTPSGNLQRQWTARATLDVTPVNPFTNAPLGPTEQADIREQSQVHIDRQMQQVDYSRRQQLNAQAGSPQRLMMDLKVGPNHLTRYRLDERC